jgi:hypothetical protein
MCLTVAVVQATQFCDRNPCWLVFDINVLPLPETDEVNGDIVINTIMLQLTVCEHVYDHCCC